MSTTQTPQPSGWFSGRTRLVTMVSVVAVGLAGAIAFGANLGILDATSNGPVGNAAAVGDLAPPTSQVVDVYLPGSTTAPSAPASALTASAGDVEEFDVDVAGTVAVAATGDGVRLERVVPSAGWRWTLAQSNPRSLDVTLTNGSRTFQFTASKAADGSIAAKVTEPITATAPTSASSSSNRGHDDHEDVEHEYEGGEDDD
jgi:hypothetical protein